jgi:DNA-binding XRE family transcriptional regulator
VQPSTLASVKLLTFRTFFRYYVSGKRDSNKHLRMFMNAHHGPWLRQVTYGNTTHERGNMLNHESLAALGEELFFQRIERGWSVAEAAEKAGVAAQSLYHLEQGRRHYVHALTLMKVARLYDLDLRTILGRGGALAKAS